MAKKVVDNNNAKEEEEEDKEAANILHWLLSNKQKDQRERKRALKILL